MFQTQTKMTQIYTPGHGEVDALTAHGLTKLAYYNNMLGYVEAVEDGRFAVCLLAVTLDGLIGSYISDAVLKAVEEVPDRDVRDLLLRDVGDPTHSLLARLGYYFGTLRYRIADRKRQYVLTFAPKPGRRIDIRPLMRLLYSIRGHIETWEPLYGTVEYLISYMLREVHFSPTYNYHTLDDVCAILWTADGNDVYVHRLCDLEFVKHIYDPGRR